MTRTLAALILCLSCVAAAASPVKIRIDAEWPVNYPPTELVVTATLDSASTDQDPTPQIGRYRLDALTFEFSRLGVMGTPFTLSADVNQSAFDIYPSAGGGPGEIHLFGNFASSPMPNGILPIDFSLRLYFEAVASDGIDSILAPLAHTYGSMYLSDQIGARSSNFTTSVVSIAQAVPEPAPISLIACGLALAAVFGTRRRTGSLPQ